MEREKLRRLPLKASGALLIGAMLTAGFFPSCAKDTASLRYDIGGEGIAARPYPGASFAVISDLHVYDPALGSAGAAFEKALNADRKLLLESVELLDYATELILASGARFILIPGDLTKDGELANHELVAEKLKRFTGAGIAVYVVPGNHDINNPGAVSYEGNETAPVPTVSAEDFARIYNDFGFGAAIMRDDDSLSYVAEPVPGLWLLALDTCRYRENQPGHEEIVSGKISQRTADWIASALRIAADENKAVMAMQHHGAVEHWKGQSKLHPDYLIAGFADYGKFLASWNVRYIFTGHYHAQDISRGNFGDKALYDIETGSLITAPCPIRFIAITNNGMDIRTETIADRLRPGTDFAAGADAFVKKTVVLEAASVLRKYKVSEKDTDYIANAVGDAFVAHYRGDEDPGLRPAFDPKRLGLWGRFVYGQQKYVLDGLWSNIPPADNNVRIE